jgi:hypothetical protein
MKHANDFVTVNPNLEKKRRKKNANGTIIRFGSTGTASENMATAGLDTTSVHTTDENRPVLGRAWTPIPTNFRIWDPSKQNGYNLPTTLPTRRSRQDTGSSGQSSLRADDSPLSRFTSLPSQHTPSFDLHNPRTPSFGSSLVDADDDEFLSGYVAPSLGGTSMPSESLHQPPITLKLRNSTKKNPDHALEATDLHVYEPPSLTPPGRSDR